MKRGIIQEEYNYGGGKMSDEETVRWEGRRVGGRNGRSGEQKKRSTRKM